MPRAKPVLSLTEMLRGAVTELKSATQMPTLLTYQPHDKQCIFHESQLREKIFLGGNRSGKTVANVMECIWWLTKKHPHNEYVKNLDEPVRGRFVGVSFADGMDKIAIPMFKAAIPKSELIDGEWNKSWDSYRKILTLANGSFMEFMSYEQDLEKFAGTSRHFVAYDEEPPQHIFNECRMRLLDTKGYWWISMTPLEGLTWIYDTIYEPWQQGKRPLTLVIEIYTTENPHIDAAEVDIAVGSTMSESEAEARKRGTFVEVGGKVYKDLNPVLHKRQDFKLDPSMTIYASYDHGWRHPAAWLWHAVEPNGHVTTFHEIIVSEHTIETLSAMVKAFEKETLAPLGMSVVMRPADPATNQHSGINGMSILSTYAEYGIYLATEGINRDISVGLNKIMQYLRVDPDPASKRPFWQYTPNCVILERQMQHLHWEKYASRKMEYNKAPKNKVADKEDDGPDSLRYFFSFMPELYIPQTEEKREFPFELPGGVTYAVDNKAPSWETLLQNSGEDYKVFEGGFHNALENY